MESFADILLVFAAMVLDENLNISIGVYDIRPIAYCVGVISDYFPNTVENRTKFFDVEAQKVDLRMVQLLNLIEVVAVGRVY